MTAIADYLAALDQVHRRGDATEHSYRPALQALLQSRATNIEATNEPQHIAGNAPDFVVRRMHRPQVRPTRSRISARSWWLWRARAR